MRERTVEKRKKNLIRLKELRKQKTKEIRKKIDLAIKAKTIVEKDEKLRELYFLL